MVGLAIWQEEPEAMAWKMELTVKSTSSLLFEEFGSMVKAWQKAQRQRSHLGRVGY